MALDLIRRCAARRLIYVLARVSQNRPGQLPFLRLLRLGLSIKSENTGGQQTVDARADKRPPDFV